jgi:hypothetical protein
LSQLFGSCIPPGQFPPELGGYFAYAELDDAREFLSELLSQARPGVG